jgi:hypothetical protein
MFFFPLERKKREFNFARVLAITKTLLLPIKIFPPIQYFFFWSYFPRERGESICFFHRKFSDPIFHGWWWLFSHPINSSSGRSKFATRFFTRADSISIRFFHCWLCSHQAPTAVLAVPIVLQDVSWGKKKFPSTSLRMFARRFSSHAFPARGIYPYEKLSHIRHCWNAHVFISIRSRIKLNSILFHFNTCGLKWIHKHLNKALRNKTFKQVRFHIIKAI